MRSHPNSGVRTSSHAGGGQENAMSRAAGSKRGSADSTMAEASDDATGGPRLQRQRVGLSDITNQMQTHAHTSRGAALAAEVAGKWITVEAGAAVGATRTRSMSTRASSGDEQAQAAGSMSVDVRATAGTAGADAGRASREAVSSVASASGGLAGVAEALGMGIAAAIPSVAGSLGRAPRWPQRQTRSRGSVRQAGAAPPTPEGPQVEAASAGRAAEAGDSEGYSLRAGAVTVPANVIDIDKDTADIENVENYAVEYVQDIYDYFREREASPSCRPSTSYMDDRQPEINEGMRGILVDWLVEVAEEYRLVPDTLYLSVAYIDRYLSRTLVRRSRLQLVGVTCMLIAAKYEEIYPPEVREFCYITDNTYTAPQVLECERRVLDTLNFELTQPTAKSFLRRYIRAAEAHTRCVRTHYLADYLCELTLLDYNFLRFLPSTVAASVVLLANYTMRPHINPWSETLSHYTGYAPADLAPCVQALHEFWRTEVVQNGRLPAIREKYSHARFRSVANDVAPPAELPASVAP